MKEWLTITEISDLNLPSLPRSEKSLDNYARAKWRGNDDKARKVPGKTKPVWQYHISLLPDAARERLALIHSAPANDDRDLAAEARKTLWDRYEALSQDHKDACEVRLKVLEEVERLKSSGLSAMDAIVANTRLANVSKSAYYEWRGMVSGHERQDWKAALAPIDKRPGRFAPCADVAWEMLKSDYLRQEGPSFSACYRRVEAMAKKNGWAFPDERSLRRRLDRECPPEVQILARKGRDKLKAIYPAQRRTRDMLHAMQAVNMDGHRFDVFVKLEDGTVTRVYLIALQDLYSGKFVAWRVALSENWIAVRLVIGDMVERHGIPDMITLDNGRAFSSKWISGGTPTRYRFKVKEEDVDGLITTLGIELKWTKPFSGQSKPIERAFRDLTDDIARHPRCAGAYTGNKPDAKPENYGTRAIPFDEFVAHVNAQMAEHNARIGRKGGNCNGRSFDQTFEDSLAKPSTIVRWPSPAQRSLWLLAAEAIRARKGNGEIHLFGNRYWNRALTAYAGQKVTVRFDPDNLTKDLKVYTLSNQLICDAECIDDAGFYDAEAARLHAKKRGDYEKAVKAQRDAHAKLSAHELAEIYSRGERATPEPQRRKQKVTRLATSNLAVRPEAAPVHDQDDFESSFSRALGLVERGAVLQFPSGNTSAPAGAGGSHEPKSSAYGSGKKKGGR